MSRTEDERYRIQPVIGNRVVTQTSAEKFQRALQSDWRHEQSNTEQENHTSNERRVPLERSNAVHPINPDSDNTEISHRMMQSFNESLKHSLGRQNELDPMLQSLLNDIANGILAGRRISGHKWKLTVRMREDFLSQTNLEISSVSGELSILFRTADSQVYQKLIDSLPQFNHTLKQRNWGDRPVAVFFINAEEL